VQPGAGERPPDALDADRMCWTIQDRRRTIVVERRPARGAIHGPPIDPEDLVHPYLGPIATVHGRWLGRESFHAGAFATADGAWLVVGPKEAGKSSLLAALHRAGHGILCDDIAVVDAGDLLAGPRALDLRERPAELDATLVRDGERWRVGLPPTAPRLRLAGWLELRWSDRRMLHDLPVAERLGRLAQWRQWKALDSDPQAFLDLAALPGFVLERPRAQIARDVADVVRLCGR
jgi:hypothetical protein